MDRELRILILEDDSTDAEFMQRELRSAGMTFSSIIVNSKVEFIKGLDQFSPDLILADYKLPSFDGISALDLSQEKCPDIPFIFVTGTMGEEWAVETLKRGASDYVIKDRIYRLASVVKRSLLEAKERTERKRAEKKILKLNRIYAVLSNINQAIVRVHDTDRLFNEVCRIAIEDGKFRMVWIGMINPETNIVDVAASAGLTEDYLNKIKIDLNDEKRSQSPTGRTIISGSHFISNDIANDENMLPWRGNALKLGYRSSASLPIKVLGTVRGVIRLYSDEVEFFNEDEIKLLDEMAMDVSFALEFIEHEAKRKEAEEFLLKFRMGIERSGDAVFLTAPDGIIVYVNPAFENIFGYTKEEAIGKTPRILKSGTLNQEYYKNFWNSLFTKKAVTHEIINKTKDDRLLSIEASVNPIINEHGEIIGYLAIERDITERKRAEKSMREYAEQYRTMISATLFGFWLMDENGKLLDVNDTYCSMSGYTKEELLNLSVPDLEVIDKPEDVAGRIQKIMETGTDQFESKHKAKDGRVFDVEISTGFMFSQKQFIVFIRDITERKLAEDALRESEDKFRSLVENISDVFYVSDQQGKFLYCSPNFFTVSGYSPQEIYGNSFIRVIAPIDRHQVIDHYLEQTAKGSLDSTIEFRFIQKDGSIIWVEQNTRIVRDSNGKIVQFRNVARDITERKRAEQEIISQKNRFAQLFENSPIAIALLDDQDKIVHINESFSTLFGYFLEEVKGQMINDIIVPPELKEEAKTYSDETLRGNQINKESYRIVKDGTLVYVQIIGVPAMANDKIVGVYSMYVDLTQRKDAEEKMKMAKELAEQSDKLKTEFLAQMSHEIRTPINAIVGNVDFLNDSFGEKTDSDTRDCFEGINLASKRIIRTVDLILNAAELQTSGYKSYMVKVDLNSEILNKLYKEHQLLAKQKGLEFIYTCKEKEIEIIADEYSITQIFANLMDNAIKYTKKGKVEILLGKNKTGNIMVEIKDTGIGISKEFLPRIFEPFVQEDQGFTRSYDGNGLGLTLVKNYCEINNAVLEVESKKNVGTTFRVIFKS